MFRMFVLSVAFIAGACDAHAWDEVTHGHLTEGAIAEVKTPALKAFLKAHRDALISGAWFPDWGHALKPQGEADHSFYLDAAHDYLGRADVRAQADYPDLLAHYMGAYAHVVEDRLLDATLKRHAAAVGEARRDDLENGMMEIASQGWLRKDFHDYRPMADFDRIYADAGYFRDPRLNAHNLNGIMLRSMERGEIKNRELKLLSFLAAGYARWIFPWGAANLVEAPGGFQSNEQAVAAGWEAIWSEAHNRPAPFFVYSLPGNGGVLPNADPRSAYGRITVVTRRRFDMRALTMADVHLTGDRSGPIPVAILPYIDEPNLYPYMPTHGHDVDLAFQVAPLAPLRTGERFVLSLKPGGYAPTAGAIAPYDISFTVAARPPYQARLRAPRPWAMGIFLLAFGVSLAGLLFGAPDLARATLVRSPETPDPAGFMPVNTACKGLALLVGAASVWLLFTDGAALIEFIRRHH